MTSPGRKRCPISPSTPSPVSTLVRASGATPIRRPPAGDLPNDALSLDNPLHAHAAIEFLLTRGAAVPNAPHFFLARNVQILTFLMRNVGEVPFGTLGTAPDGSGRILE